MAWLETPAGRVPRIGSTLSLRDHFGACKARWGIDRLNYLVPPGLYAIGTPDPAAPVVVTANYTMSYDLVRQALAGRHVWLLVLETFGINVWCAAGKGTFGTKELITRIIASNLSQVVSHHRLILPILGAPGVAAHEVTKHTGFTIAYGPIRAEDLPAFLDNGQVTTTAMQGLTFSLYERLVLIPVEIVHALKPTAVIIICLVFLGALLGGMSGGITAGVAYLGAMLAGVVLGPLLLPWLPGRSFAIKGMFAGLAWAVAWYLLAAGISWHWATTAAAFLALPAVSAFYTLNFTGCTPYTSRTGVKIEMRRALPAMGCALLLALLLVAAGQFS